MDDLKISLIISTYNWEKALVLSLKSVLAQKVLPNEIIIADDGSSQETKETINEFQKISPVSIHHVWHEDNGFRLAEIRNKAIIKAQFPYIVQMDGDIILDKNYIKDYKYFAKKNQYIRGSRTRLGKHLSESLLQDENINFSRFHKDIKSRTNGFRSKLLANLQAKPVKNAEKVIGCNMGYWREDAITVNGYNNNLIGWGHEDAEFAARLTNLGIKKLKVKNCAIGFHIYHEEKLRNNEESHFTLIKNILDSKIVGTESGITEILKEQI